MDLSAQKEDLIEEKVIINRRIEKQERKKEALLKEYKKLVEAREKVPSNNKDSMRARKARAECEIEPAELVNERARNGSRQKQIHKAAKILSKEGLIPIRPSDVQEVIQAVDETFSKNFVGAYFSNSSTFERIERGQYLYKGQ